MTLYPGSRRPRALPVDECASVWPRCRPAGAWSRVPQAMPVGLHWKMLFKESLHLFKGTIWAMDSSGLLERRPVIYGEELPRIVK